LIRTISNAASYIQRKGIPLDQEAASNIDLMINKDEIYSTIDLLIIVEKHCQRHNGPED